MSKKTMKKLKAKKAAAPGVKHKPRKAKPAPKPVRSKSQQRREKIMKEGAAHTKEVEMVKTEHIGPDGSVIATHEAEQAVYTDTEGNRLEVAQGSELEKQLDERSGNV